MASVKICWLFWIIENFQNSRWVTISGKCQKICDFSNLFYPNSPPSGYFTGWSFVTASIYLDWSLTPFTCYCQKSHLKIPIDWTFLKDFWNCVGIFKLLGPLLIAIAAWMLAECVSIAQGCHLPVLVFPSTQSLA